MDDQGWCLGRPRMTYVIKAVKWGSGLNGKNPRYQKIEVPAETTSEARRKAELRLGAEWGVFSITPKGN